MRTPLTIVGRLSFLGLLLLVGCQCDNDRVTNPPRLIEASPASVDFGTTTRGMTVERLVLVRNLSRARLTLNEVSLGGEAAASFLLGSVESLAVEAGGEMKIRVVYAPATAGVHSARLVVLSDATNAPELTLPLLGAALSPDACAAITCNQPPGPCFETVGTCSGGACSYAPKGDGVACNDGNDCTDNDACVAGACSGTPKACVTPPAGTCSSTTSFTSHASPGACVAGACQYTANTQACTGGCSNGACQSDPCAGVSCTTPPSNTCATATSRRTYPASGACTSGTCSYAQTDVPCSTSEVCQVGLCKWADSSLTNLTVVPGSLTFSPSQTMYAVTVPAGTTSVAVTATVSQPSRATVRIDGTARASGTSATVSLSGNATTVTVQVDAESGASTTYAVVVTVLGGTAQQAYLKAASTDANDVFGWGVALSADGSTLAVGATRAGSTGNFNGVGSVYVFTRTGSTWAQQASLRGPNTKAGDLFGNDVALSADGNTLVVGAAWEDTSSPGVSGVQAGAVYVFSRTGTSWAQQGYLKASNTEAVDVFGGSLTLSADGSTLAVGAYCESSSAVGVNGNQADNSTFRAGAVYIFTRIGSTWAQSAYLKASNTGREDYFGATVHLSADATTLAVGALGEDSSAIGVNGNQADNFASDAGAVYVFIRTGTTWAQQAYLKPSNTDASDSFGWGLALSADGSTLAVSALAEDSSATGINGNQADNSAANSGAVYVFTRTATTWAQQAYLKASNTGADDRFGPRVALSANGSTLAVGASAEDSSATGVNGNQADDSAANSGAVYVFTRTATTWAQQAYLKASNTGADDQFGRSLALSGDGSTLAVGAPFEDSSASGVNGNQTDNSVSEAGAAYVFTR